MIKFKLNKNPSVCLYSLRGAVTELNYNDYVFGSILLQKLKGYKCHFILFFIVAVQQILNHVIIARN